MPKNGTSSLTNHSNLARHHGHHSALRFGKCPVPNHFHRHPVNLRHQPIPSGDPAYRHSHILPILPSIVLCLLHSGTHALDVYIIRLFLTPFQPRNLRSLPSCTCTLYSSVRYSNYYVFVPNCQSPVLANRGLSFAVIAFVAIEQLNQEMLSRADAVPKNDRA